MVEPSRTRLEALLASGAVVLDVSRRGAVKRGQPVALTENEYAVLARMLTSPGAVRQQLERVDDSAVDPFGTRTRVAVMTLTRKLCDAGEVPT